MGKHLGVAYNLRLSQELRDKISESAKQYNRSMNADIVARLEKSFAENPPQPQEQNKTPQVHSDFIHDQIYISDQAIEKLADKLAERLNQK